MTRPSRRTILRGVYVLIWLIATIVLEVPIIGALTRVLSQMPVGMRIVFYAMPPILSAMLVLGVLQIISMYRYWFGSG